MAEEDVDDVLWCGDVSMAEGARGRGAAISAVGGDASLAGERAVYVRVAPLPFTIECDDVASERNVVAAQATPDAEATDNAAPIRPAGKTEFSLASGCRSMREPYLGTRAVRGHQHYSAEPDLTFGPVSLPSRPPTVVRMVNMETEMATHDGWLRALDAEIETIADAVGAPTERSITQRLDTIERVLFALARAQGIDPDVL